MKLLPDMTQMRHALPSSHSVILFLEALRYLQALRHLRHFTETLSCRGPSCSLAHICSVVLKDVAASTSASSDL